jgi:hypothetical protein
MGRSRSPSYPQIGLREAVQRVKCVYDRDYRNSLTRGMAAERLGYSGLNGKSLAVLAALVRYGLVEGRGDEVRVTDLAARILAYPLASLERSEAVAEAARQPALFGRLDERFAEGAASDAAIRAWLVTQGFIPPAAEAAVRSYRETKQFLAEQPLRQPISTLVAAERRALSETGSPAEPPARPEGVRRAVFGLAEGEVVITAPVFLSAASVEDLRDYLEVFMKRALREAGLPDSP